MTKVVKVGLVLMFLHPLSSFSQLSQVAVPYSVTYKLAPISEFNELPSFDHSKLISEDKDLIIKGIKSNRFAEMISVAFNPYNSGVWAKTSGGKVWRLGIRSANANSLYIVLEHFKLNAGVNLFVYNPDGSDFAGAFTSINNSESNVFAIAPIQGDVLILELNVPLEVNNFGQFDLTEVYHAYRDISSNTKLKSGPNTSNACEVDINCADGNAWKNEARAVCRIIANKYYFTGTLINSVDTTKLPYLLTAHHTNMGTVSSATSAIFDFVYEKYFCGSTEAKVKKTLSGSTLIATTNNRLDFSLLKLNVFPPRNYRPYLAGWNISANAPQSAVCIHHPMGDAKKISIEQHALTTSSAGFGYDDNSHWRINDWETGTTEGGSSGSAIFNASRQIVGTLTGGPDVTCEISGDDYAKFSLSWNKYSAPANQLKSWLDPKNTGVNSLNGYDPYGYIEATTDTSWNILKTESTELSTGTLSWGYLSGQNSSHYSLFAEKFFAPVEVKVSGIAVNVAKAYGLMGSNITFQVWKGNGYPSSEIYSLKYYIKNLQKNAINYIDFDSVLNLSGQFYVGYQVNYASSDTFAVFNAETRGVGGKSTLYIYNGTWNNASELADYSLNTSLAIALISSNGIGVDTSVSELPKYNGRLKIFPNPCIGETSVIFEGDLIDQPKCFNLLGQEIPIIVEPINDGLKLILPNYASGMHFIKINTTIDSYTGRFMVIKKDKI